MSISVDSSFNPAIHARQTALLYRNGGLGQLFTVLAAIPTAYLGYISRPGAVILVWLLCMVVASYLRYRLARRYRAMRPSETEAAYWSARYVRIVAVQAVLWLAGCAPIMWDNTDSYRFLVALVLAGMVGGAVPVLGTFKDAFRVFALPMMIGASLITFANASAPVHYVLGIVLLIFLAGVTRSADYFNEVLLESITVELEKSHLVRKAEAAVRAKGDFLANVSHEIRTPMNSILGMAQLAFKGEHDPRQRDYLKKIQQSGEHLLGIIDDILDISKIDAGKVVIEVVDFELAKVMENLANLVADKARDKNLSLTSEIDHSISPYLRGDPLRLCQVLTNLVNNAIKFTEKGTVVIRIKRLEQDGGLLRFEVQDPGIGMTRDEVATLFQSFQQADSSTTRKYGGTGLGLAICKQLVEMMEGGKIGVESFPGKGSTFWFTVRLPEGVRPAEAQLQERGKNESGVLRKIRGARILLVDDNAFNLEVAADFLLGAGAVVTTSCNGKEAIGLLRQRRFDCVLLDVQMPVMDGIEAVRQIRLDPAIDDVPVIAMTANAAREDKARYLSAGMDDVIVKPFKYQTLFTTLAKWLPRRTAAEEDRAQDAVAEAQASHNDNAEARPELTGHPDIIDLSVLAEMTGGDFRKISELANKFVATLHKDMEAIEAALERSDLTTLGALGHYCKSPARLVGAIGFAELCQALEDNARGGNLERAHDIVEQLRLLPAQIEQHIAKVLS